MARILVTGAGGYIGNVVVDQLLKANHQVVAADWMVFGEFPLKPFRDNPNFELLRQDIRTLPARTLRGIDTVCDLAALPNEPCCALDPDLAREINHLARARIARIAKAMGLSRFITLTSALHYEAGDGEVVDETCEICTDTKYSEFNQKTENVLFGSSSKDFAVTVLRSASVYGLSRRMRFDLIANAMILHAHKTQSLTISGDGSARSTFIHVRDLARSICEIIDAPAEKVAGQIYNVGGQNLSVSELAKTIASNLPEGAKTTYLHSDELYPTHKVSFDKIKSDLGFEPRISIAQGVMELHIALKGNRVEPTINTHTQKLYAEFFKHGVNQQDSKSNRRQ